MDLQSGERLKGHYKQGVGDEEGIQKRIEGAESICRNNYLGKAVH